MKLLYKNVLYPPELVVFMQIWEKFYHWKLHQKFLKIMSSREDAIIFLKSFLNKVRGWKGQWWSAFLWLYSLRSLEFFDKKTPKDFTSSSHSVIDALIFFPCERLGNVSNGKKIKLWIMFINDNWKSKLCTNCNVSPRSISSHNLFQKTT